MKTTILAACALGLGLVVAPMAALAEDLVFDLHNQSSLDLHYFQASPTGVAAWEEDILGEDIVAAGQSVTVTIADGRDECTYDMRFIMANEAELVVNEIDLCALGSYTLTD